MIGMLSFDSDDAVINGENSRLTTEVLAIAHPVCFVTPRLVPMVHMVIHDELHTSPMSGQNYNI